MDYRRFAALAVLSTVAACSGVVTDERPLKVESESTLIPSWEQFRNSAMTPDLRNFVVDGDLYFDTEDRLRGYYDQKVAATDSKLAIAHRISDNYDAAFVGTDALDIVYCVSDNFKNTSPPTGYPDLGDQKAEAITDIASATRAWEDVVNVHFRYDPSQDSDCNEDNEDVDFAMENREGYYSADGCGANKMMDWVVANVGCPRGNGTGGGTWIGGVLIANYNQFPLPDAPTDTRVGLLTHEVGHILGFRHEFAWADSPCEDAENTGWDYTGRRLTAYDDESVMNYITGSCPTIDAWVISKLDGVGARSVYGMPVSWYVAAGVL